MTGLTLSSLLPWVIAACIGVGTYFVLRYARQGALVATWWKQVLLVLLGYL